jgi:predicted DNA-binding transcriptional regulator AlpA
MNAVTFRAAGRGLARPEAAPLAALLTAEDFRRILSIGRRTFQTWRAAGRLPAPDLEIGKVLRWRPETVEAWLAEAARKTGNPAGI